MTKLPPGYVAIHLNDLMALHAARQAPPPPPPDPVPATATAAGLAEAISLLAARIHGVKDFPLSGDVDATAVTGALALLATALLRQLLPRDRATAFLTDLGTAAANEGTQ